MFPPPRRVSPRQFHISVFVLLLLVSPAGAARAKNKAETADAVVAIGDVHGAFDDFVAILQRSGLIDKQNHWAGGKAVFVQTGDLIDRGPKPREVMDLMMALEQEAPKRGGRVAALLGNHEVMNLMGDLRYVTPENYASFADSNSEQRQKAAYQLYVKWRNSHGPLLSELPQPMEITEAEWMARHPVGFVEHAEAFGPNGIYGKWVRSRSALGEVGNVVFLHGGIDPGLAHLKVDTINGHIRDEIKSFDETKQFLVDKNIILPFFSLQEMTAAVQAEMSAERKSLVPVDPQGQARMVQFLGYGSWLSVAVDGPLWFRGYDKWTDDEGMAQIGKILDAYDAAHIVVGHTVQKGGRIRPRFGNKVFLIDTGMLSSYYPGGRASALEICGGTKFTAEYSDQSVVLIDPANPSQQNAAPMSPPAAGDAAKAPEAPGAMPGNGVCSVSAAAAGK
jgi:Calcineurin-like phosphoesterase